VALLFLFVGQHLGEGDARGIGCLARVRPGASCSKPATPWAMKRACQRQIVGLPLPVCRWIAIVRTPSALSSTIRARHTCFCGLFPEPITASSRSRSPGPSRTSMPFLIQPDSHIHEPTGIIRQRLPGRFDRPFPVHRPPPSARPCRPRHNRGAAAPGGSQPVGRGLPLWLRVEPASRAPIVDLRRAVVALPIAARVEAFAFSQLLPFNLNDRRSGRRLARRCRWPAL
jgi:hypothetical protein